MESREHIDDETADRFMAERIFDPNDDFLETQSTPLAIAMQSRMSEEEVRLIVEKHHIFRDAINKREQTLRRVFEKFIGCTKIADIARAMSTTKQNLQTIFKRRMSLMVKRAQTDTDSPFKNIEAEELTPHQFKNIILGCR